MQPIRTLLAALLLAACALPAAAQTIKTLGFNTTNGHIVYSNANPLRFTNEAVFGAATSDAVTISDQGFTFSSTNTNTPSTVFSFEESGADKLRQNARSSLDLGATWLTNANVTNFRTAIGLGELNSPAFAGIEMGDTVAKIVTTVEDDGLGVFIRRGTNPDVGLLNLGFLNDTLEAFVPIGFNNNTSNAATTRTNLGLPLQALTNGSNVTMMRALSGSTNTNHPFSGSISVTGTNNTNTLVFSNGILQSVQ